MWVWSCDDNCNPAVNPATHVRNGFFHFFCHESTQICKYDQCLLSKHAINRNNKQKRFFCFSWQCLPWLYLFYFSYQSRSVLIGLFLWISQYDPHSLTSIMASVWLSHRPRMMNPPLISNTPLPRHNSSSDLLWPWRISGSSCMKLGEKAHRVR